MTQVADPDPSAATARRRARRGHLRAAVGSLGALLAVCLAGLQFLAVLIVVSSSYVTSEQALIRHARDLLHDVGVNTIEHSKGFLQPAEGAAELAARLAQNRVIASDDPALLEQLLFQQLVIAPQFAGVYYGAEDGSFVYVMRTPNGPGPFRSKLITLRDGVRQVEMIWRRADFSEVERRGDPADVYDPRSRPWYLKAQHDRATIWTDPYIFFTSQQPGITLASPVMNESGGVRGVVGVDIEISMISGFLARLNVGTHGKAMIIHRNGDVIAHPDPALLKTRNQDGTLSFAKIDDFDDPVAHTAFGPLFRKGRFDVTEEKSLQFVFGGARYVSTVMPVTSEKLPWNIAVYAPEDDFTSVIKQNRTANIWLAALIAALTGLVGLALAAYISKPVRAFAVRSSLISQGELDPSEPLPKTYREIERANAALVQQIAARRATEQEYGRTFELSSRGMAQLAPETDAFLRVNARFCEITGYSAAELRQMRFADLCPPDEPAAWSPAAAEAEDPEVNRELRCRRKDGQDILVALNAIMIRDGDGAPRHAVITMEDVTEARRSEEQIRQLNRELSHLARGNTMGQMASGLAHELNQPLTAIAQNADTALLVLDQTAAPDPELREILTEIERESLRAGDIIRALRAFVRKDEGRREVFDFCGLLEQTLHLVQADAADAGVVIETATAPDLPLAVANRVQIAQVLVNLMRNAIEAMAGAGTGAGTEGRRLRVEARPDPAGIHVCVEDTGPGIPPGLTLFVPFETTKPDGMGLGLSICRTLVEANGGTLWQGPQAARGARFCFTVPQAPPS